VILLRIIGTCELGISESTFIELDSTQTGFYLGIKQNSDTELLIWILNVFQTGNQLKLWDSIANQVTFDATMKHQ